jgi:pyruvate dehydrogenase (quinone)
MMNCNTLLMIGTDFPYQQFFPPHATIIQIDLRGEQLGRRTKVDYGIVGDTKATLQALFPKLKQNTDNEHLRKSVEHYRKTRKTLDDLATEGNRPRGSHPQFVARQISELASEDAIFTCDVGTPTIWAARYLKMNGKRRLLGSFSHGSMANALPQAIGVQLTAKDRQVVSMSGDGGISMLLGDLLTLHQLNLPVKIVVFRNNTLDFVELEMKAGGFLDYGTELRNPDFAALAESAGLLGLKAETPQDVGPMLEKAFKHDGPALVEVLVHRQELSMPPTITLEQAHGFGMFMLKAVISGRGDELTDLAKVNLFR